MVGGKFVPPSPLPLPYKRLYNLAPLMSYIFVSFQQITFKLCYFTNLKALFSVVLVRYKSWKKTVEMSILKAISIFSFREG